MPATYNGIGTHYYGRKNEEKRQATCQQCGCQAELTSYDTRLWFVIVFIPVLPLGRKRIVDQCPACTRHYVLDLKAWETAKQVEISGALEKFRTHPTPEAAIEAHQTLVNFHQLPQAAEFRQMMQAKFPDNPKVQAYLGLVLEHLGQVESAAACFHRALDLRPDLPDARAGMARAHIKAGRLDEARALIDFLEKPGAGELYSLAPLETLALSFKHEGRCEESLQLFARLLEARPSLADYTIFRKNVETVERALNRPTSILPRRKFSWKRFLGADPTAPKRPGVQVTWRGVAWVGGLAALILLAAILRNDYVRRHRTLRIINALTQPAMVEVRGAGQVQVRNGTAELVLPEGRHHASITGPAPEELDFEMRSGFLDRWFKDPVWVLNVGGSAVLVLTTATYSRDPQPPTYAFHFGRAFEYFPNVTHFFRPLPESLRMKSHESRTLTQLELHRGKSLDVFNYLQGQGHWSEAWRLAENHLRLRPEDAEMLRSYVAATAAQRQSDRAETFLKPGLTNRPVRLEWHRAYQSLKKDHARDARLAAEYDVLLQTEPGNADLLYLRGRVSSTREERRRYFDQSVTADPRNPFPFYAQGYDRIAQGDWAGARKLFQQSAALRPDEPAFTRYLHLARFALGEYRALEQEYRDQLRREPLDFPAMLHLGDVLIASGKTAEATQAVTEFERIATTRHGDAARGINSFLRRRLLYATSDFAGLERHAGSDRSPEGRTAVFHALLEQGRVTEALKLRPGTIEDSQESGFVDLTVALAWALNRDDVAAKEWEQRAIAALKTGDADDVRAADLLRRTTDPTPAELEEVVLQANSKAILLAYLANRHPTRREELSSAARRLNVDRGFPHHLVQRATANVTVPGR